MRCGREGPAYRIAAPLALRPLGGADADLCRPATAQSGKVLCEGLLEKCSDGKRAATVGNLKGSWDARYVVMTKEGLWWFKTKEAYESKDAAAQGMFTEMASSDLNVRPSARLLPEPAFASSETECFVTARGQYDDTYLWMQFITPDRILSLRCATAWPWLTLLVRESARV